MPIRLLRTLLLPGLGAALLGYWLWARASQPALDARTAARLRPPQPAQ